MTDTRALLDNRFDRRVIAPGVVCWIYEYRNREPIRIARSLSTGLEVGVQLEGRWWHAGRRAGAASFEPGMMHVISPAERFDYEFAASSSPGRLVGFTLYPDELDLAASERARLSFAPNARVTESALVDLSRAIHARGSRAAIPPQQIVDTLRSFVARHCVLEAATALSDAKAELDRHFDRPLYLHQICRIAGMHAATFARAFRRRYGVTPARYRIDTRLNHAVRLCWSRPDLSIAEIARQVGFEDLPYFYRTFSSRFGMTPAQIGRRGPYAYRAP